MQVKWDESLKLIEKSISGETLKIQSFSSMLLIYVDCSRKM